MRMAVPLILVMVIRAAVVGCSSSSPPSSPNPGCTVNPFTCSTGLTCWPGGGYTFFCSASGVGKEGDACQNLVAAECGDGLMCLQLTADADGKCARYCDALHPCAATQTCSAQTAFTNGGTLVHVCTGSPAPIDGGTGGDSSATDSGAGG
jgi:hypothetical protein